MLTPPIVRSIALFACLAATVSSAMADSWAVETASTSESLTGNRGTWHQAEVLGLWQTDAKSAFTAAARRVQRFGLNDVQVEGGASMLVAPGFRVEAEVSNSSTHQVLPQWAARGRVWANDVLGFNVGVGAGRSLYRRDIVQGNSSLELQVERYVSDFRLSWRGNVTQLDGGGRAAANMLSGTWYANDHVSLGLIVARGREADSHPGRSVILTPVRAAALTARWRVAATWSLGADVGTTRVGDAYTRSGFRLGLRHHF